MKMIPKNMKIALEKIARQSKYSQSKTIPGIPTRI